MNKKSFKNSEKSPNAFFHDLRKRIERMRMKLCSTIIFDLWISMTLLGALV